MSVERFKMELSGECGEFWVRHANEELQKRRNEITDNKVTFLNGVAYWNSNNRCVPDDIAYQFSLVTDKIDFDTHKRIRKIEDGKLLEEYRKARENYQYSDEEICEMRSVFGAGKVIVDCITGKEIQL